ncbi:hypothetical protein [Erwinia sp. S38]|uniref:hypothetical protein n=1 Tax=Erwinia sp. S38 TaxID=2769338 RepID=UPI00190D13D2|nr:hypothetical protein [Erwinia sp. S38]MBK0002944.1 hypothetical protein [Erwinia sp. S38]
MFFFISVFLGFIFSIIFIIINAVAFVRMKGYFKKSYPNFFGFNFKTIHTLKITLFIFVFLLLSFLVQISYKEVGYLLSSYFSVIIPLIYRSYNLLKSSSDLLNLKTKDIEKKTLILRLIEILPDIIVLTLGGNMLVSYISFRNETFGTADASEILITSLSSLIFVILLIIYFMTIARILIIEDEIQREIRK